MNVNCDAKRGSNTLAQTWLRSVPQMDLYWLERLAYAVQDSFYSLVEEFAWRNGLNGLYDLGEIKDHLCKMARCALRTKDPLSEKTFLLDQMHLSESSLERFLDEVAFLFGLWRTEEELPDLPTREEAAVAVLMLFPEPEWADLRSWMLKNARFAEPDPYPIFGPFQPLPAAVTEAPVLYEIKSSNAAATAAAAEAKGMEEETVEELRQEVGFLTGFPPMLSCCYCSFSFPDGSRFVFCVLLPIAVSPFSLCRWNVCARS